jgi:hypothetical protein
VVAGSGEQRKEAESLVKSAAAMTGLRFQRSANTPPVALNKTVGVIWLAKVSPEARGEPVLA